MLRKVPVFTLFSFVVMLGLVLLPKQAVAGNPAEDPLPDGYYFCHHLGNDGYNTPNASSAGVVFGHLGDSHQDGLDIIPPFTYQGQPYEQNWDAAGQAIWANGCVVPDDPTATTPPDPTATTPAEPTATTPAEPTATTPAEPTATTAPGEPTKAPVEPTATTQVSVLPVTGAEPGGTSGTAAMVLLATAALFLVGGASVILRSRARGR